MITNKLEWRDNVSIRGGFALDNSAFVRWTDGNVFRTEGGNGKGDDDSGDWGSTGVRFYYDKSFSIDYTPTLSYTAPNLTINIPKQIKNEVRTKSKFFNLLIYAGYPIA